MDASENTLHTAFNPEYWAREMQGIFFKENLAIALANTELRDELPNGTIIHKPYRSYLASQTYTKGTDISTFNTLASTDDYLTVDTTKVVPFYVDEFKLSTLNFVNCWNLLLNILAKTEYLKGYIRTMLENNMLGTISSQA